MACSLERLNNSQGYTRENTRLICIEFNTADTTVHAESEVTGSAQWSKQKFSHFISHIRSEKIIDFLFRILVNIIRCFL